MSGELDDIRKDFDLSSSNDLDDIRKDFESTQSAAEAAAERTRKSIKRSSEVSPELLQGLTDIGRGFGHGIGNVGLSVLYGINQVAGTEEEKRKYDEYLQNRANEYQKQGNAYKVGNLVGETAATGPLAAGPVKAIQATKLLPTVRNGIASAVSAKNVLSGATAGGIFGAATTAGNPEQSALENTLEGAKVGAVAGPAGDIVGKLGSKAGIAAREGIETSIAARTRGMNPGAAKYTIDRLTAAGLTPAQIRTELQRLGPKATLADIDPALLTEAGGIAGIGDEATSIMKNRFQARADSHNLETTHIINRNLGGNPDLEVLKDQIIKNAQKATSGDYNIAKSSTKFLDTKSIIDDIDNKLVNAVGSKKAELGKIKSYFYNEDGSLKNNAAALHEIRMQLDANINKKGIPVESYDSNTLNAAKDIRRQLDERLKSIPEMKAADEKFAEKMDVLKGVDIGKNFDKRNINYAEFAKEWNNANSDKKKIIQEGMKGKIYDLLEGATRGEMSEAKRLFGQASANRAKFKLVFGTDADEVLDALEKEAIFQSSERAILSRSHTAEGQAVQQRLGLREKPSNVGDIALGIGADIASGSSGVLTALGAVRHAGLGYKNRLYKNIHENRNAALADIFSQSGAQLNSSLNTLNRVSAVRNRIPTGKVTRKIRTTIGTLPIAATEEINREMQ